MVPSQILHALLALDTWMMAADIDELAGDHVRQNVETGDGVG